MGGGVGRAGGLPIGGRVSLKYVLGVLRLSYQGVYY